MFVHLLLAFHFFLCAKISVHWVNLGLWLKFFLFYISLFQYLSYLTYFSANFLFFLMIWNLFSSFFLKLSVVLRWTQNSLFVYHLYKLKGSYEGVQKSSTQPNNQMTRYIFCKVFSIRIKIFTTLSYINIYIYAKMHAFSLFTQTHTPWHFCVHL